MMVRNSSRVKIGIGVVIAVMALCLAPWLDRGFFAEEVALSQSTIEQGLSGFQQVQTLP